MEIKALDKLTYGLYVLGVEGEKGYGGCIVDAVMQATMEDNPLMFISLIKRNYTPECLKRTGEFTLSVLREDCDPLLIGLFGFQSARSVDKWSSAHHELWHGLPVLRQGCAAAIYGKVEEVRELSSHTLFVCRVHDADLGQGDPMIYANYLSHGKTGAMRAFQEYKKGYAAAQGR